MDQVCAEAWAHTAPSRPKVPLKLFLRLPIVVENSSAFRKGMATSFYPRIAPALHSPVQMGNVRIFWRAFDLMVPYLIGLTRGGQRETRRNQAL